MPSTPLIEHLADQEVFILGHTSHWHARSAGNRHQRRHHAIVSPGPVLGLDKDEVDARVSEQLGDQRWPESDRVAIRRLTVEHLPFRRVDDHVLLRRVADEYGAPSTGENVPAWHICATSYAGLFHFRTVAGPVSSIDYRQ
jgi:hypothetical protein